MFKKSSDKILLLIGFFAFGFFILPLFNKPIEKANEKSPSFYDADINADIEESLETGYLFKISNKTYKPGTYHYVIRAKQNDERIEFLEEEQTDYDEPIVFHWRHTKPPYRLIKKAKADTLYIIKNGRTIAFQKYFDKDN